MYRGHPTYSWQTPQSHVRLAREMRHGLDCGCHVVRVEKQQKRTAYGKRPSLKDITSDPAFAEMTRAWEAYLDTLQSAPTLRAGQSVAKYIDGLPWTKAQRQFIDLWMKAADGVLARQFKYEAVNGSLRRVLGPAKTDEGRLPAKMFDLDNPFATEWAGTRTATLVREVFEPTRQAIRGIVEQGFTDNKTVDQIARMISGWTERDGTVHRGVVGLLERDAQAVVGMYARLTEQDGLSPAEASKQASRYADDLLRSRGRCISRTEVKFSQEGGKQVAWETAKDRGLLLAETRKVWVTGVNDMTCESCAALDGASVEIDEDFEDPLGEYDAAPGPPLHPNCACSTVLKTSVEGMTE